MSAVLFTGLPSAEETRLLRACVHDGEAGRRAWDEARDAWTPAICAGGGTAAERQAVKPLWPLLAGALRRNAIVPDPAVQAALQALSLREEARGEVYRLICGQTLQALSRHGLSAIVLNGAALAETVYPEPGVRHCHDLDLLVSRAIRVRATAVLGSLGCWKVAASSARDDMRLVHTSGFPLELHTHLLPIRYHPISWHAVRSRSWITLVAGCPVRVLSPPDSLVHVCGLAACAPGARSLRRVCDAWFIVNRHPDLDWALVIRQARRARLAVSLYVTLRYLARELGAPIPPTVLDQLETAAAQSGSTERQLAFRAARANSRRGIPEMLRATPDVKTWVLLARWMLWPSPTYLRLLGGIRGPLPMALWYLRRPFSLIGRMVRVLPELIRPARNGARYASRIGAP